MATATRKDPIDTPEPAAYNMGLDLQDMKMPRLRVVGNQAKAFLAGIAKPGDLMIGADAEDEDSQVVSALNAKETLRIYVLKVHANYACKFGGPQGQWEEGDADMPPEAKRQYNLTLFVPSHSTVLPVTYTAGGSAAGVVRKVNTRLQVEGLDGHPPYEIAYAISTVINTSGTNTWPGPVFARTEAVKSEVAAAKAMHDALVAPQRAAISAGVESANAVAL